MAHLLHKHYGSWHQEVSTRDILRYTAIAVVALLGVAGLLQSIAGGSSGTHENQHDRPTSVYGQ